MNLDTCLQSWQYGMLAVSATGLLISIYTLLVSRYTRINPGTGCGVAMKSRWAELLYLRNETVAVTFFILMGLLIVSPCLVPQFSGAIFSLMFIVSTAAILFVTFLLFVQWRKLKRWCGLCVAIIIVTIVFFALELTLFW